jgi:hypothetical protein
MTTIPEPTDVHAARFRALQALGSTAKPERQGPKEARRAGYGLICGRTLIHSRAVAALSQAVKQPPERALRPAHGWPGRVDMAIRPLPAARPFVPLSDVLLAIPLDAIPAVTMRVRKQPPERAQRPAAPVPGVSGEGERLSDEPTRVIVAPRPSTRTSTLVSERMAVPAAPSERPARKKTLLGMGAFQALRAREPRPLREAVLPRARRGGLDASRQGLEPGRLQEAPRATLRQMATTMTMAREVGRFRGLWEAGRRLRRMAKSGRGRNQALRAQAPKSGAKRTRANRSCTRRCFQGSGR